MSYIYNLIQDNTCILAFMSDTLLTESEVRAKFTRAYGTNGNNDYSVIVFEYKNGKPTFITMEESK